MSIEVTHDWKAGQWDWPIQQNDGIVKVHYSKDKWEVGLDCAYFTPKEIEVKVVDNHLNVHCRHEIRDDEHGSISREISRSYKLPDDIDVSTISSHLTKTGILRISAQKK